MTQLRILSAVLAVLLVVLPGVQAGLQPVLDDPTGDESWRVQLVADGPGEADPARERLPQNGSTSDVQQVRLGENRTHIFLELELRELPPSPEECATGPVDNEVTECNHTYRIMWTFFGQAEAWGTQVLAEWDVDCRAGCGDGVFVGTSTGDAPFPPLLYWERRPPDTLRWVVDKRLFQRDVVDDDGELRPARLCEGDAFLNFRIQAWASPRMSYIRYSDLRDTQDTPFYRIQHDSPACPAATDEPTSTDELQVLDDRTGDYDWHPANWVQPPMIVHDVRDVVLERNGSGLDIDDVRVARNRSHVTVEMDLGAMPPPAEGCRGPTPDRDRCRYDFEVFWTLWRRSDPWGPEVRLDWTVGCRPECRDRATVRVGDGPNWTAKDPVLDIARVGEKTLRWTIDKRVFQTEAERAAGGDGLGPARLCSGDLMLDFRAWTEGFTHFGANHYQDEEPLGVGSHGGAEHAQYLVIAEDSPGCPTGSTQAAGPVAGPASVQGIASTPSGPASGLVAAAVAAAFVVGRRSGP